MTRLNRSTGLLSALALATALGALASCGGGPHLREDQGVRSHAFFDRQAKAASDGTAQGLDSEEASLIHESYRETLGQRARRSRDPSSSMLILENGYGTRNQK